MGYEIRKVPKDWKHPRDENNEYVPLRDGMHFDRDARDWIDDYWKCIDDPAPHSNPLDYVGSPPNPKDYMWVGAEADYFMAYQNISEGTPLPTSEVRETSEEACEDINLFKSQQRASSHIQAFCEGIFKRSIW